MFKQKTELEKNVIEGSTSLPIYIIIGLSGLIGGLTRKFKINDQELEQELEYIEYIRRSQEIEYPSFDEQLKDIFWSHQLYALPFGQLFLFPYYFKRFFNHIREYRQKSKSDNRRIAKSPESSKNTTDGTIGEEVTNQCNLSASPSFNVSDPIDAPVIPGVNYPCFLDPKVKYQPSKVLEPKASFQSYPSFNALMTSETNSFNPLYPKLIAADTTTETAASSIFEPSALPWEEEAVELPPPTYEEACMLHPKDVVPLAITDKEPSVIRSTRKPSFFANPPAASSKDLIKALERIHAPNTEPVLPDTECEQPQQSKPINQKTLVPAM
ncbi:MAG: hypothetical protein AMJ43_05910 [Coxiella sp. DG_40]|nr:MAG: hypothetical protein AMJ43_05910 [Coxiella sp. DG_40]